ncbi:hypothetical protein AX16_004368 [Volvariella volvacea WC 439]|nr:hypothetical protein AX16_004368 [Volvariella volvacea WC 439]
MTIAVSHPRSPVASSPGIFQSSDGRQWIRRPSQIDSPYTYTPAQIMAYLREIAFQLPLSSTAEESGEDEHATRVVKEVKPTWDNLVKIIRGHLLRFPFDNTTMHYSASHEVDITPEGVFKRLIEEKKGGSWCFGLNGLLYGILRGLGYRVYTGSARVNETPGFIEPHSFTYLGHMIIFVQPFADYDEAGNEVGSDGGSRATYLVDVGLASRRLMEPILLDDSEEGIMGIKQSERHRLRRSVGAGMSSTSTRKDGTDEPPLSSWFLQVRNIGQYNDAWRTIYTFTEAEYLPRDYAHSNVGVCYTRSSLLWDNIVVVRHVPANTESGTDRIILFGSQVIANGETRKLESEEERIRVLKEMFGVDVGDVEEAMKNIRGRDSALVQGERV